MVHYNISGGAPAPQHDRGLLKLLLGYDEAKAKSFLSQSEVSRPRLRSPISGLLLQLRYDPVEVLDIVYEIWPSLMFGHSGPGRKQVDRLPLICYLLPLCDPVYGTVYNFAEAYRDLRADKEYRRECGYVDSIPSLAVFRDTAVAIAKNWRRFQSCALSSDDLEKVLARIGSGAAGFSKDSISGLDSSTFAAELQELGWSGNLPPLYRQEEKVGLVGRTRGVVGRPRGRTCKSGDGSVDGGADDSSSGEGGAPRSSKKLYPRDWPAYNYAQTHELLDVKALLGGMSDLINLMDGRLMGPQGRGRPRFPLGHAVFCVMLKVYFGISYRRAEPHLVEAAEQGYLRNVPRCHSGDGAGAGPGPGPGPATVSKDVPIPQFNTVGEFMKSEWLTPLLLELVTVTALPLRGLEDRFAVDGTGLGTDIYKRWFDHRAAFRSEDEDDTEADMGADTGNEADAGTGNDARAGSEGEKKGWVKLHAVTGVRTNIIVRAAVSPGSAHDTSFFRGLMYETVRHFDVKEVSADLAYASGPNHTLGGELGFKVLVPFKSNTLPPVNDGSAWSRDLKYYLDHPDEFWLSYHQRSNVESTFSAMKRVFPEQLRTKEFCSQVNEALCKVIAHNLRTVAREVRMRGIDLDLPADALVLWDCIHDVVEMRRPQPLGLAA